MHGTRGRWPGQDVTDLVQDSVSTMKIIEYDQSYQEVVQAQITLSGDYADGSTFEYTSMTADPDSLTDIKGDDAFGVLSHLISVVDESFMCFIGIVDKGVSDDGRIA
jgi:hypothetical protein